MACSHVPTCALFPLFTMQPTLKIWQISYCEADFTRCARFQKSCSGETVPPTLLPNGQLLGKK